MISTLKRTLTDIMEDELYSMPNSQSHSATCAQQASQQHQQQQQLQLQQRERPQSQNSSNIDLGQYLHLNGSQDSMLQSIHLLDDPRQNTVDPLQNNINLINLPNSNQECPQPLPSPSRQLDQIYNSYGNPSLFANCMFPDELQPNNYSHTNNNSIRPTNRNSYSDRSSSMGSNFESPLDTSSKSYTENDDVVVIPQDNYYIYDPANSDQQSFLPELLQFNISSKPLNPSNELNIFKPDFYVEDEEFSDEDDEDDDNPNKLDDMEMDLDDMSSESSFGGDLDDEDYFKNDQPVPKNKNTGVTDGINSIYCLTQQAQTINPRDLISRGFQQQFNFTNSNEKPNMMMPNTENLYIESDVDDNEDAIMDDNDDVMSDEEEDDDELYTPAFEQRRESVLAQQKPSLGNTKRSPALEIHSPTLRKLKTPPEKSLHHPVSNNGGDDDDHICLINNPKTGLPCNKKFSRPYDLIRHQNTIHATKRSYYRCMFCEDDLRRKNNLEPDNEIVIEADYRNSTESLENSNSNNANSHNTKKMKNCSGGLSTKNGEFFSNKTFSRCDALTRHLRFRHGLNNQQVSDSMDYAKKNVEYYEN